MSPADLLAKMAELAQTGVPFVVATVVRTAGSTPRAAGAKMVVFPDGSTIGTVGGGRLEFEVTRDALAALARGESEFNAYRLRPAEAGLAGVEPAGAASRAQGKPEERVLGMLCGGDAEVFLEVFGHSRQLLIVGAGHIGQKLAEMARALDFRVVVVDERADMVTEGRFPEANELICASPSDVANRVSIGPGTMIVIVTHGHLHDKAALAAVVDSPAAYIGMIGSRSKVRAVMAELRSEGADPALLDKVHAPIGLDLGGQRPAEIALSILAEIVADQYGGSGRPMKGPVSPAV
jgi:xanthine dehydrogenase accessory factor